MWISAVTVVGLLIAAQLLLPFYLNQKVTYQLQSLQEYEGTFDNVNVSVLTGSYSIQEVRLKKNATLVPLPFFSAKEITFSLAWDALLKGKLLTKIVIREPVVNFVKGPSPEASQTAIYGDWATAIKNISVFPINAFTVSDGELNYLDFHALPKIALKMTRFNLLANNLMNLTNEEALLPSRVSATALLSEAPAEAPVTLNLQVNTLQRMPLFDMHAAIVNFPLNQLNPFFRAYKNLDIQHGTMQLDLKAKTQHNKIIGTVNSRTDKIEVAAWSNDPRSIQDTLALNQYAIKFASWRTDASVPPSETRVNFEADITNNTATLWCIVGETLQHAFLNSIVPFLENSLAQKEALAKAHEKPKPKPVTVDKEEKKEGFFKRLFKKKENKRKKD